MNVIDEVRERILADKTNRIWDGYVNMLKILESVFVLPESWVLEFLQNAEDAKATRILIRVEPNVIEVLNDGEPFTREDIDALCDVKSRKIPAKGFKGYLGIGFKSIYRVTNHVEVHSGEHHFKFDSAYWKPDEPWEILPLNVPPCGISEGFRTRFIVSAEGGPSPEAVKAIADFLLESRFPKEALLTLHNVREIQVVVGANSVTFSRVPSKRTESITDNRLVTEETTAIEVKNKYGTMSQQSYRVYRTTVSPPPKVKEHKETQRARRADVTSREVGMIFPIDSQGRIQHYPGTLAGVYSFMPLQMEQTGLPFSIFGDFIPQPGRDLINYGAEWNVWMCREVRDFLEFIVRDKIVRSDGGQFIAYQLLSAIQNYTSYGPGQGFWEANLRDPLLEFLKATPLYPDASGKLGSYSDIRVVPDQIMEILGEGAVDEFLAKKRLRRAPSAFRERNLPEKVQLPSILRNIELLGDSLKHSPEKVARLYETESLSDYMITGRDGRDDRAGDRPLTDTRFVLGADEEWHLPSEVFVSRDDIPPLPPLLQSITDIGGRVMLHPEISKWDGAVSFLQRCGVDKLDRATIANRIKGVVEGATASGKLPPNWSHENIVETTRWLIDQGENVFVSQLVAQDGSVQDANRLFVIGGLLDWLPVWKQGYLPGYEPVHDEYLKEPSSDRAKMWLREKGVHGFDRRQDDPLIRRAAEKIATLKLSSPPDGHLIQSVAEMHGKGYDLECVGHCKKVFEVKGMVEPDDISIEASEFKVATIKQEDYIVYAVYNLPRPDFKCLPIPNPEQIWRATKEATIPLGKWLP